ncbi:hypothetical protein [Micromonospora sp. 067-2]|uniref:hypothetical protein n=1 Tax=Micromonospora sp. 067-2 TaxID=2789270 RepID=UPI003978C7C3
MPTTSAEDWPEPRQSNESGVFIGRDNYGPIHHIDEATRGVLKKLAKEAPALHEILKRAINEGLVSPDVVYALQYAARSINEDVAMMLNRASSNINEDVAMMLVGASTHINGDNASTFMAAADKLGQLTGHGHDGLNGVTQRVENLVERLERTSSELADRSPEDLPRSLDQVLTNFRYEADRIEGVVTPPPAQIVVNWKATWLAFLVGIATGLAFVLACYVAYRANR